VLDRDQTRYEITVRPPDAVKLATGKELLNIGISQISLNQNCRPPDDESAELQLLLSNQDVRTVGPPPPSQPPTQAMTGATTVVGIQSQSDVFFFSISVFDPSLNDAKITTVVNGATDKNRHPVDLFNVSHGGVAANIPRGGSVGAFSGLPVLGDWSSRVGNLSATLLDSRLVEIVVSWSR
jgi:hypothetical protein